ncbi:thioredoxin-like protein [Calycina marina]|uniref:thioredoxin-dependent peroxiredoxin n=1 Tax=Calycina marina TaxID=1763456 RepID=A0A9P8CCU9_9HELO|nr:thioredoxin-like protein [Calycina marina]
MSLERDLAAVNASIAEKMPLETRQKISSANTQFQASFDPKTTIQNGDTFPAFRLRDALGQEVSRDELLIQGPLLITFYRGGWCPYCNLALRSLHLNMGKFLEKGVQLVAISPEVPDASLSTTEKHDLKFTVLSDAGNQLANDLGILFVQDDKLRPIYQSFGFDLKKHNGDDSFAVPIPATFLLDKSGVVKNSFIDPDYTKRLDPTTALKWIDDLNNQA